MESVSQLLGSGDGTANKMFALLRFTAGEPGATVSGIDHFPPLHSGEAAIFLTRSETQRTLGFHLVISPNGVWTCGDGYTGKDKWVTRD